MATYDSAFQGFGAPDIDAVRAFYGDRLGIRTSIANDILTLHLDGRDVIVYPKEDHVPATFTILNFDVADIEAAVDDLVAKGVEFEHYEWVDERGINRRGGPLIAWFKDPAGNICSVIQED